MRDYGVLSSVQPVSGAYGISIGSSELQTDSAKLGLIEPPVKSPTFSDMFLVYSTLPGT